MQVNENGTFTPTDHGDTTPLTQNGSLVNYLQSSYHPVQVEVFLRLWRRNSTLDKIQVVGRRSGKIQVAERRSGKIQVAWSAALEKYRWRSAALEKFEQRSALL